MTRTPVIQLAATVLCIGAAASPARAHHSHAMFYDPCKSLTIEGRVDSVTWKQPHILFDVTLDDGTTYHAEWTSLEGVTRNNVRGSAQDALAAGARVVVTGNPLRDPARIRATYPNFKDDPDPKIVDVIQIRRTDDSWDWARPDGGSPPKCSGK